MSEKNWHTGTRLTHEKAVEVMRAIAERGYEATARTWALNDGTIVYQIAIEGRLQSFDCDGGYMPLDMKMVEDVIALAKSLDLDLRLEPGTVGSDCDGGRFYFAFPPQYSAERTTPSGWPPGRTA